ncbi:MAG: radical SAM protein [Desulforhopalus sp.]
MDYVGNLIRPPSEANSIILQVTVGCSYNKCTFCAPYKGISFHLKDSRTVDADLQFAKIHCRHQHRLFLADGDVLILSQKDLLHLLDRIRSALPWVKRVSLYGNARAVRSKSIEQLAELKELGLDRIYMGLESGCDEVLKNVCKGETAASMTAASKKVNAAGLFLSITVLLGLGGRSLSNLHASETAKVLCAMAPRQIAALTLMVLDNTPLGDACRAGDFVLPTPHEILQELHLLVSGLHGLRCQFHANHASTYLPLSGRLPRDQAKLLDHIESALSGITPLVPDYRRAL